MRTSVIVWHLAVLGGIGVFVLLVILNARRTIREWYGEDAEHIDWNEVEAQRNETTRRLRFREQSGYSEKL